MLIPPLFSLKLLYNFLLFSKIFMVVMRWLFSTVFDAEYGIRHTGLAKILMGLTISYSSMNPSSLIDHLMEKGADYCDVRKEIWDRMSITLKSGEIDKLRQGGEEGVMIRVLHENGWGCVGTSDPKDLKKPAERALSMAKSSNRFKKEDIDLARSEVQKDDMEVPMKQDPRDIDSEEKISFLRDIENKLDEEPVNSTEVRYGEAVVKKKIFTSEGDEIRMNIPRSMTYLMITGKSDTIQRASEAVGGTGGYELTERAYDKVDVIKDRLEKLLEGDTPPSGSLPLIMDPKLAGVFVHEAFGHAAEGDLVSTDNSCLKGKVGEKVAADHITIRDDPTYRGYGHFPYDDEGTEAKNRVLVKDGILNDFILDKESAWKLDMEPNGGARAEDFRVKPLVRMSNTIMEPGNMKFEELLEEVDEGVYAKSSSGGQVSPAEGTFQFNAQESYLIEDGEIKKPLRDVSFNGFTLETLQNVVGITDECKDSVGHCGKGQTAPVGHAAPHVLISDVTVGGRE